MDKKIILNLFPITRNYWKLNLHSPSSLNPQFLLKFYPGWKMLSQMPGVEASMSHSHPKL